ncbi:MAG: FGGY-family carbohydrate kinase [Clostridia bacterium]|nr:FGGY-family carbohydrate kinase [Clostridia bacterium]
MKILALEASTSSAKAMLYETEDDTYETAQEAYPPSICSGGLTDTEAVFLCTARLGRQLAEGRSVSAVALCSTWHSVTVCDRDMHPVTRTHNWNYMATESICRRDRADRKLADELYARTGCMPHVTYPRQMLRYMTEQGMDFSDKLTPTQGAYNFYRLTGEYLETVCNVSGSGLINLKSLDYDACALAYCGIGRSQLGRLCSFRDTLPLDEEGARLLGIEAGIPVVPAHADGALNQIGDGAAAHGRMTVSVGTSGAVRFTAPRPMLPDSHALWGYYGAADYMAGAATAGACNCVNWYKDTYMKGMFSFGELESGAALPDDLPVFLPFLFGERCPGWHDERLGGFVGVRPEHNLSDLYHAIQQGVLFNLCQCYDELVRDIGAAERIVLSGGILNSAAWTQLAADIFRHEIEISTNPNASLMGAVVLGMHAAGAIDDIRTFEFPSAAHRRRVFPDPARAKVIRRQYERYLESYEMSTTRN